MPPEAQASSPPRGPASKEAILEVLEARNCLIFHATQLVDFQTYCASGGVVPRRALIESGRYTPFYTDETDRERGLLNLVFGNLGDFGHAFGVEPGPYTPNIYGPITILFQPQPLWDAEDIVITDKPAADDDYDRLRDALGIEDLESAFQHPREVGPPESRYLQPSRRLLELSAHLDLLPFVDAAYILVDPLTIAGVSLVSVVKGLVEENGIKVYERNRWSVTRVRQYAALAGWVRDHLGSIDAPGSEPPDVVRPWWEALRPDQRKRVAAWARYLYPGTLQPLEDMPPR